LISPPTTVAQVVSLPAVTAVAPVMPLTATGMFENAVPFPGSVPPPQHLIAPSVTIAHV